VTRSAWATVALLMLLSACAPRTAPPVVTPRFPTFVYPAVPPQLGADAASIARHDSGWRFLQLGELRAAERDFRHVVQREPGFFPAQAGLGYVSLARRDFREALEQFDRAVVEAPQYLPAVAGRGEALLALGRHAEALTSFEAVLAANPELADLRARVESLRFRSMEEQIAAARRARAAGRHEEARTAYQRAIAASPESAFLHRELATVEQTLGRLDEALAHVRRATELDPGDARAHVIAGEIYESRREYDAATRAFEAAAALEPSDELADRITALRERATLAELPPEYRAIPSEPQITRAQLAALIAVRLEEAIQQGRGRSMPVMTDVRSAGTAWAAPWIAAVVRAGVMDPYPNHTFQPEAVVRRGDLAQAVSRLLAIVGQGDPRLAQQWQNSRPRFEDLPPSHLSYPAAALAATAGVLGPLEGNTFQPGRPVSGEEAFAAIDQVERLLRARPAPLP
jgi:tetratricopeptide (TPR) repeat protein